MITEWKALSIANINAYKAHKAHKAHRGNGMLLGLNDFDFEII
ncbi:hypothetical protein D3Z63_08500 [Vibrio parahaemolyticus]|uniref:Uncharacterized protein n=1 Tax=Vibrio parahaemolyticus TaxID=670 RepID=A0A249VY63_VIBPH|nr:hypothetical protein YA91_02195 [Vibrio parahaemolyticus]EQL84851.1 hypothetical protein D052_0783 [Vibrio parahaemolyticus 10290]ESV70623.1 hypothetical protein D021_0308 [Vibrio parahaemolyticus 10296]ESW46253.1 hypothetical protein D022_0300 [Vibrio parahaemolyticus 12310]ETT22494.1 hypothetical protein D023_0808 [Vibrio parahaemolyticus 3256]ETX59231.1 hypothetical protein D020_0836 [Vibrio parahaemolyticus SBR10290]KIS82784.1 hypothetical protein H321_16750 [Vibrio parahaemolyticus 97